MDYSTLKVCWLNKSNKSTMLNTPRGNKLNPKKFHNIDTCSKGTWPLEGYKRSPPFLFLFLFIILIVLIVLILSLIALVSVIMADAATFCPRKPVFYAPPHRDVRVTIGQSPCVD